MSNFMLLPDSHVTLFFWEAQTTHATSWLISWAISKPGILDSPTSRGLARSIPLGSEQITEALVSTSDTSLYIYIYLYIGVPLNWCYAFLLVNCTGCKGDSEQYYHIFIRFDLRSSFALRLCRGWHLSTLSSHNGPTISRKQPR